MEALATAWQVFRKHWMLPTALAAIAGSASLAVVFGSVLAAQASARTSPLLANVASWAFQVLNAVIYGVGLSAQARVAVVALQGHEPTGAHVTQGLRRAPGLILVQLASLGFYAITAGPFGLLLASEWLYELDFVWIVPVVAAAALVLLPAYIYLTLAFSGASLELAVDPDVRFAEAMRRSWQVSRGQLLTLGAGTLISIVIVVAGAFACCVGLFPASAFMTFFWTATYMALRTGVVRSADSHDLGARGAGP
jgi:hypothetical protein